MNLPKDHKQVIIHLYKSGSNPAIPAMDGAPVAVNGCGDPFLFSQYYDITYV